MKIVVIEDEQFSAADMMNTIHELRSDYKVIKILSSVGESKDFFSKHTDFDLIFSDIHLGDGLSFEIFSSFSIQAPVVFCTAYDNYAIEAFKANGIDYVLKPIDSRNIQLAIEKFERLRSPSSDAGFLMNKLMESFKSQESDQHKKSILVRYKEKIIPVKLEDVALFYIRNESTSILDFKGNKYAISETLDEIEVLDKDFLFRANRQFIVNRKAIQDASHHFSRKLLLKLNIPFEEQISISKEKTPAFLNWLQCV